MTIVPLQTAQGLRNLCSQYFERKALGMTRIRKDGECFIVEELTDIEPGTNVETWTPQTWTFQEFQNYKLMLQEEMQKITEFQSEIDSLQG